MGGRGRTMGFAYPLSSAEKFKRCDVYTETDMSDTKTTWRGTAG